MSIAGAFEGVKFLNVYFDNQILLKFAVPCRNWRPSVSYFRLVWTLYRESLIIKMEWTVKRIMDSKRNLYIKELFA